jgi:hypothetical protein
MTYTDTRKCEGGMKAGGMKQFGVFTLSRGRG